MRVTVSGTGVSQVPVGRCWALVPAAGSGTRMGAALPKQYLTLHGRTVLEHALLRLITHPAVCGAVVALSPQDPHWASCTRRARWPADKPLWRAPGGAERCHSVLNGLAELRRHAAAQDWVLVHDAARPCVRQGDISALIERLAQDPVGGLLAVPVRDTMKRGDDSARVVQTVERMALWHALTPQMFRLALLERALREALDRGVLVTDESAAVEALGLQPRLCEGHADNLKITRPEDLALAEFYLHRQEQERADA